MGPHDALGSLMGHRGMPGRAMDRDPEDLSSGPHLGHPFGKAVYLPGAQFLQLQAEAMIYDSSPGP